MATDVYGLPTESINYGMGAGWLPFLNQRDQLLAAMDASRGQLGAGLLDTVTNLMRDPAAGPLGLAAYGAFGGGSQAASQATGGAGVPNPYGGLMDKLLAGLSQAVMNPGSPFNPENKGQYNTGAVPIVDPNKAPMMTPESAAKAPNVAQDWINAWEAYNPGKTHPDRAVAGLMHGGEARFGDGMMRAMFGADVPVYDDGGTMAIPGAGAMPGAETQPDPMMLLKKAEEKYVSKGGTSDTYWKTLKQISRLAQAVNERMQSSNAGESSRNIAQQLGLGGDNAAVADISSYLSPHSASSYRGTPPDSTFLAGQLLQKYLPQAVQSGLWLPQPGMKQGGGMTIGGEPHYVVDSQGQPVAALTEDGKPERVEGVGGVEVTPLDPMRHALYEARKRAASAMGKSLADMTGMTEMPMAATGGELLFPDYPGGGVDTSPGPRSDLIPTFGGPSGSRQEQVGDNYFKSVFDKATGIFSLPDEARDATVTNDPAAYAKLIGGALSAGNTAVPIEALQRLNAGLAPDQLLSANVLATLAPSQRSNYFALLEQMGLGSREDNEDMIRKGRPDTFI